MRSYGLTIRCSCRADHRPALRAGGVIHVAQVVAAGHTHPALASDVSAQGEGAGDERPDNRGVDRRVDGEARPERAEGKSSQTSFVRTGGCCEFDAIINLVNRVPDVLSCVNKSTLH